MSHFSYLAKKIKKSKFVNFPFQHIYIENFFKQDDFIEIQNCPEIETLNVSSDKNLISELKNRGYKIINFPGCITDENEYIKWHNNKSITSRTHSACEGFGLVMRLYEKKSKILIDLDNFLKSDEFNSTISQKLNIKKDYKIDSGIQKYLDGYEISPHPDIRKKAATYMVNIFPSKLSESEDHHTHYLKFTDSKKYIYSFWENNIEHDRDWVPWSWCETVFKHNKNNSIVIFSPSDYSLHAVRANYNHLKTQRVQLYGNLWYKEPETWVPPLKWESLEIPKERNQKNISNLFFKYKDTFNFSLKSKIKKFVKKDNDDIGNTNMG